MMIACVSEHTTPIEEDVMLMALFQVELVPIKRHLETKSKYVASLQKRGVIKEVSTNWGQSLTCVFMEPHTKKINVGGKKKSRI